MAFYLRHVRTRREAPLTIVYYGNTLVKGTT